MESFGVEMLGVNPFSGVSTIGVLGPTGVLLFGACFLDGVFAFGLKFFVVIKFIPLNWTVTTVFVFGVDIFA